MAKLAERYASLKGTRVIAHRMDGDEIVFVLESGSKLRMNEAQLQKVVDELAARVKIARAKEIDLTDGVDATEATLAGKALQARKKKDGKV